jgi:hypothetical protein
LRTVKVAAGTKHQSYALNPSMPAGPSGAQPTYGPPIRQVTHEGAHSLPGTQSQPKLAWRNQRP